MRRPNGKYQAEGPAHANCNDSQKSVSAVGQRAGFRGPVVGNRRAGGHGPGGLDRSRSFCRTDGGQDRFRRAGARWLRESESYACGVSASDWDALAQSKVKFVTHCPVNRDFFIRCHALGIRCFPYVTFYQAYASQSYQDVNLKDHPEFIEVDAQGNLKRTSFWDTEDAKNMYTTCPNVAEYQDAMVAWVRKIMELGADGVFVDNISSRVPCYGPKFGKHKHLYDNQDHAYAMLLKRVRQLIKRYQPDGALIVNSASPLGTPAEYWKYIDADMLESYICTWVSKERWFDWKTHWHAQGVKLRPYLEAGKQVQALSYLGHTPYGVKEDAFFCYATARLAGFVWNGGSLGQPETAALYRLRLGQPLGDEVEENGVYWRAFQAGLVAVNPDRNQQGFVTVKPPIPTTRFVDVCGNGAEDWTRYEPGGYVSDVAEKHGGAHSAACHNKAATEGSGLLQIVELNQDKPTPIVASGWSKAQNVSGQEDGNYAIYLDILYQDGTPLYGQVAPFACGTHDWQQSTVTVTPAKPIKSVAYHALFRGKSGSAWFDDLSLRVADERKAPREVLENGGLERPNSQGVGVDVTQGKKLPVPAYSGRVFLYAPATTDELGRAGPQLTVVTTPGLGEVRFRVDGFDYWTFSGSWGTEYMLGPNFGTFSITFDKPGKHVVELIDVAAADMKTPAGYGSGERLGQFMDPSNPTRPSQGRRFRFRGWTGPVSSRQPRIEVDVSRDTRITAQFEVGKK